MCRQALAARPLVFVCVPSLTDVIGAGGVAPRWRHYVAELRAHGWLVEVWCVDGALAERRVPRCVHPFFPLTLTDAPSALWMVRMAGAMAKARPDVLVVTDMFNDVNLGLLARGLCVPLVYSMHTDGSKLPGGVPAMASLSQALTARLATGVVTTSASFARVLIERCVIPSASAISHYKAVPTLELEAAAGTLTCAEVARTRRELMGDLSDEKSSRRLLVYVGRWSAEKRIALLVRLRLSDASEDWTLAIVGDAADERVAKDVERWHDPPRVVVRRGMLERGAPLALVYKAADWLVSASDMETFGNTAQEAAACGTPGLLQKGPGFVDQIPGGVSSRGALLDFDQPDSLDRLKQAMRETEHLLQDPDAVKAAARAGVAAGCTIVQVLERCLASASFFHQTTRVFSFQFFFKLKKKRKGFRHVSLPPPFDDDRRRRRSAKAPPAPLPARVAAVAAAVLVAATLRIFTASYGAFLRVALWATSRYPSLIAHLRPPAKRVRWAGALNFSVFRKALLHKAL